MPEIALQFHGQKKSSFRLLVCIIIILSVQTLSQYSHTGNAGSESSSQPVNIPQASSSYPPPRALTRQYWGTFYYVWYGDASQGWAHWNEAGHNPPNTWASMYMPDPGNGQYNNQDLYSSLDPSVLTRHLSEMNRARFDFALVSWWGQGSVPDQSFRQLLQLDQSNPSLNLKLGIYYEIEAASDPSVNQIVNDLTYISDQYSSSPAFFKVTDTSNQQYPVVFVYAGPNDGVDYTARWAQARAQMYAIGKPVYVALKVWASPTDSWTNHANDVDSWHQYAPAIRFDLQSGYSAFAAPSYWEYPELAVSRGRANPNVPLLPRDLAAFTSAVQQLASLSPSQARFLLIETFNEFHEGSMIEPAIQINHVETGFSQAKSSYGFTYIDIVRNRGGTVATIPPPASQQAPPSTTSSTTTSQFQSTARSPAIAVSASTSALTVTTALLVPFLVLILVLAVILFLRKTRLGNEFTNRLWSWLSAAIHRVRFFGKN